ncbi:MAG: Ribosome-recycling factor [Candidatus Moranbacteria bacterium GW2011_GWF2_34_56]|nr:MAG: Ribosome-recycling factor [Candidatus Moranbacteria bacterium GW2011_GWF1_34_10]KKP64736.1 MAG: Ribosome-recycling factor [Candidatus Moranbacteria bacterium GW2011_GWF2_34_56]HBI17424.1 ribosome recycling factor [Candidatus Moranbacteria bacterium]
MYKKIIEDKKKDLDGAMEHFKFEMSKIRTGRANPSLVEDLLVDYYGTKTPLKQIANINVPEPRTLLIQPWGRDTLSSIETAIKISDLNLTPNNDGEVIRISIPALNEERRMELVKILNKKAEEARISVRNIREDIWREIQELEKNGEIAEDDKFRGKERLQEVINEYNKKIDEMREKKEQEILTV